MGPRALRPWGECECRSRGVNRRNLDFALLRDRLLRVRLGGSCSDGILGAPKVEAAVNPAFLLIPVVLAATGVTIAATTEGNAFVERVVDGDTVVLGDGSTVRLIGIDAPESDDPCGRRATDAMRDLVEGKNVVLGNPASVRDEDKYGRLLRYVNTDVDPSASLLSRGLAAARYDSTDGYDAHPRQAVYHALEAVAMSACPTLDRDSQWFGDPASYREHIRQQRLAAQRREAEVRERRRQERADRREERERRAAARREAERREYERMMEEFESESRDSVGDGQPDAGYTGPRCYAPGGQTWTPC